MLRRRCGVKPAGRPSLSASASRLFARSTAGASFRRRTFVALSFLPVAVPKTRSSRPGARPRLKVGQLLTEQPKQRHRPGRRRLRARTRSLPVARFTSARARARPAQIVRLAAVRSQHENPPRATCSRSYAECD